MTVRASWGANMRAGVAIAIVGLAAAILSGCADPNTRPTHVQFADNQDTLVMGPNLRLVNQRGREIEGRGSLPTVCTEPSPDVAIALNRSLSGSGTVTPPAGGTTVTGTGTVTTTQTATEIGAAGHTAGVIALRDGLYAACQSYVNGVLGHDAYAVILSQYGNLLVSLTGTGSQATRSAYTPAQSAIAALFVACISEYDPTRIYPVGYKGKPQLNPMLSPQRCSALLNNIANGRFLAAEARMRKSERDSADKLAAGKPAPEPVKLPTKKPAARLAATD